MISLVDSDRDGRYENVWYLAHDPELGRNVSIADFHIDGQIDMRFIEPRAGQPSRAFYQIGGEWRERVKTEDGYRVSVNGTLYPIPAAREQFGVDPTLGE